MKILILLCAITVWVSQASGQTTSSTYSGPDMGNWNKAANWSPAGVPNNTGSKAFDVTIDNKPVTLDIDVHISSLRMAGDAPALFATDHSLSTTTTETAGPSDIEFTAEATNATANLGNLSAFSGTTLDESIYLLLASASAGHTATVKFNGAHVVTNNGGIAFVGAGTTRITDENGLDAFRDFNHNLPLGFFAPVVGATYTIAQSMVNEGNFSPQEGGTLVFGHDVTLVGDLRDPNDTHGGFLEPQSSAADNPSRVIINGQLTNYDAASKTLHFGRYNLEATDPDGHGVSTIQVLGGPVLDIVNNDASIVLMGGSALLDKDGNDALRNLAVSHRLRIAHHNMATIGSLTSSSSDVALLTVRGDSHFTVNGDLIWKAGKVEMSPLAGFDLSAPTISSVLDVKGKADFSSANVMRFELFGPEATGTINVAGSAALAGELQLFVLPDAPVISSGSITLLTAKAVTGAFNNVANSGRVIAYGPSELAFNGQFNGVIIGSLKASYGGTSIAVGDFQPHASVLNIATRLNAQTGDNVGVGGFIVRGITPMKVLVRGIGPSLTGKGVAGALQDPTLELQDSSGAVIASNDNWQTTQKSEISSSGIAPTDARESALIATLDPGNYTAVMRGAHDASGVALVELYDLDDQPSGAEFANLSTRGLVRTGDNVMIGGLIVGPDAPAMMVVRALGPSLAGHDVASPLKDPTLEVRDDSGTVVASNDNWLINNSTTPADLQNEGLAPSDYRESAVQVSLKSGKYTAIVRGHNDTQGTALVEFYKLN